MRCTALLNISIIILAGGKSSRMQEEKAFVMIDDQRLIDQTVAKARNCFREVIVVTNNPEAYRYLDIVITSDVFPGEGPLAGIHAGLIKASFPHSLVVACDMPFASLELGVFMAREATGYDVVVPVMDGGFQPLHAVYSKGCIPVIEAQLQKKVRKTTSIYEHLKVKIINEEQLQQWGISPWAFFNVNTPEELRIARSAVKELK